MSQSVNSAILIGRVGKDPEIKTFANGGKIVSFSLATSRKWKDRQSGERKEATSWHRVVVSDTRLADVAEKYVAKGQLVFCKGSIETRQYTDRAGAEKQITEICLRPFEGELNILVSPANSAPQSPNEWRPPLEPERTDPRGNPIAPRQDAGGSTGNDLDDPIPFAPCWR